MKTNSRIKLLLTTVAVPAVLIPVSNAATIVDDNFSSGNTTNNARFRYDQIDLGWYKDASSDWTISSGVLSNPGTTTGIASEGPVGQLISTLGLGAGLTQISVSFDYTVGAGTSLYFHLIGWTQNGSPDANEIIGNTQPQNGGLQNQGDTDFGDVSILTGADPGNGTADTISFAENTSGTYSQTFTLTGYSWSVDESPGLTGSITSVLDFDFIQVAFATDMANADGSGAVSIDNLSIQAIPEPSSAALLGLGLSGLLLRRRRVI
ncbi:PEP-CTERM sorting domain-containing protein [Haloferula chungangensis]|uniref:PEP-CTERM sorting domain-containing protein n=1 Tax=Haloferula chungangensis TaxID=1048331 RepID=A0ABW2L273_9BACT